MVCWFLANTNCDLVNIYCLCLQFETGTLVGPWSDPKSEFSGTESPDPDPQESQKCLLGLLNMLKFNWLTFPLFQPLCPMGLFLHLTHSAYRRKIPYIELTQKWPLIYHFNIPYLFRNPLFRSFEECITSYTPFPPLFTLFKGSQHSLSLIESSLLNGLREVSWSGAKYKCSVHFLVY